MMEMKLIVKRKPMMETNNDGDKANDEDEACCSLDDEDKADNEDEAWVSVLCPVEKACVTMLARR